MTAVCNLDGRILPEADAQISVLDRGFLFGDSVYEVMRTRDGVPFAWPEHLERLRASADGIALVLDLDDGVILARLKETLAQAGPGEHYVRIIVTRGVGTAPSIDLAYAPGPPTWVVLVRELLRPATDTARLAVVPRLRTDRRALDPAIKSGNYLNNLLGLAEARASGATDCLFLNREGQLTEASTANFYMVRDGRVLTPPLRAGLLQGITRRLLFEHCEQQEIPISEQELTHEDLATADEAFLSSTLRDIQPAVSVDGVPLGDGKVGALTARLQQSFGEFCARRTREIYAPRFASA